jgi:hypothetical protein
VPDVALKRDFRDEAAHAIHVMEPLDTAFGAFSPLQENRVVGKTAVS